MRRLRPALDTGKIILSGTAMVIAAGIKWKYRQSRQLSSSHCHARKPQCKNSELLLWRISLWCNRVYTLTWSVCQSKRQGYCGYDLCVASCVRLLNQVIYLKPTRGWGPEKWEVRSEHSSFHQKQNRRKETAGTTHTLSLSLPQRTQSGLFSSSFEFRHSH